MSKIDINDLKLVKLEEKYISQLNNMMDEWSSAEETIIPYAIAKEDYRDFEKYLKSLDTSELVPDKVPDSTYFCLDIKRNIFVGAINIRHYLNDALLFSGGHIGGGVRPSERRRGVSTCMIKLSLEKFKELNVEKILITCDKSNIGSAKSIVNNGGILDSEFVKDGVLRQRYWITI